MIVKNPDSKEDTIATLEKLISIADRNTKIRIEQELRNINAGIYAEKQAAFQMNSYLRDSKTTAVIHDLRIDLNDGHVAQIDHLLIHRNFRFYVLETKNFHAGFKITDDGSFLPWNNYRKCYTSMASPIEQNNRHIHILKKLLKSFEYPDPYVFSFILYPPEAKIIRSPNFDSKNVISYDKLISAVEANIQKDSIFTHLNGLMSKIATGSLEEISAKIISAHRPIEINYAAKFGLQNANTQPSPISPIATPASVTHTPVQEPSTTTLMSTVPTSQLPIPSQHNQAKYTCKKCHGSDLAVSYGKFGYYFKCKACEGNTAIAAKCTNCGGDAKIRKAVENFFFDCNSCKSSNLFFVNK
jgi:Nuclease-related domain